MDTQNKNNNDDGFTLIEMMVVLFIIMLLSAAVYFTISGNQDRAVQIKTNSDIQRLSQALEMYRLDMLDYPPEEYGLQALRSLPNGLDAPRYNPEGYVKSRARTGSMTSCHLPRTDNRAAKVLLPILRAGKSKPRERPRG